MSNNLETWPERIWLNRPGYTDEFRITPEIEFNIEKWKDRDVEYVRADIQRNMLLSLSRQIDILTDIIKKLLKD